MLPSWKHVQEDVKMQLELEEDAVGRSRPSARRHRRGRQVPALRTHHRQNPPMLSPLLLGLG